MTSAAGSLLAPARAAARTSVEPRAWIFSPGVDLCAFTGPSVLALGIVALAPALGIVEPGPDWMWIAAVLCVDVAHVWSTAFVTYLDPRELARRPHRYWLVPALGWLAGVLIYSIAGALWFWRLLAYVAVFHFMRQQYGWVALYRARAGDKSRIGAWIDAAAIYGATAYPLLWWHAHLPRRFDWFIPGDFLRGTPELVAEIGAVLHAAALIAYVARAALERLQSRPVQWGKHALVASTAATWFTGIVATDSDLAFMLTNVLAHGIPYAVLVFAYARHDRETASLESEPMKRRASIGLGRWLLAGPAGLAAARFVACLWILAFAEELLWDRAVWHERPELFGAPLELSHLEVVLVPFLALPQLTHYVLDGLFWRRADNPALRAWLRSES